MNLKKFFNKFTVHIVKNSFRGQPLQNIAISYNDYLEYGCPICESGEHKGFNSMSGNGCQIIGCVKCAVAYTVCNNGIKQSVFGQNGVFPIVEKHKLYRRNIVI